MTIDLPPADFLEKLGLSAAKDLAPILALTTTELEAVYRDDPEELRQDAIKARVAMAGYRVVAAALSDISDRLIDVAEKHGFEFG